MDYGYARCSTTESRQDINRQVRELKAAGAEQVFLEYEHGDSAIKEQQTLMFESAAAGDSIITLEVPRLARSTKQLCEIIDIVREKHLRLVIIGSITSTGENDDRITPIGKFIRACRIDELPQLWNISVDPPALWR